MTFVVSGVAKGVDPMGLAYKLKEYLNAFELSNLDAFSTDLSVGLCGIEIALGLLLLLGLWRRSVAVVVTLFMAVFTIITYEIYTNPYLGITECGCFGDAIELSNEATFWKNIVLLILAIVNIILAFTSCRKHARVCVPLVLTTLFISFSLPLLSYHLLPPFDFLGYNIGDSIIGSERLVIYDGDLNDVTTEVISPGESLYIITARGELNVKNKEMIKLLTEKAEAEDRDVIAVSSDGGVASGLDGITSYVASDLIIKSMMRRQGGVILVSDGIIKGKWSIDNRMTRYNEVTQRYKVWVFAIFYMLLILLMIRVYRKRRKSSVNC